MSGQKEKENNNSKKTFDPDDIYYIYLEDIGKFPLLTEEEEIKLAKKIKDGDEEAKELFINSNLRLVVDAAKSYFSLKHLNKMDLIQEGTLGLIRAVEKFDVSRGNRFSTYATPWIKLYMRRAIPDQDYEIRIPIYAFDDQKKIQKIADELSQKLGRTPTLKEVFEASEMKKERFDNAISAYKRIISSSYPITNTSDNTILDIIDFDDYKYYIPDENILREQDRIFINSILDEYLESEQDEITIRNIAIVKFRYGFVDGKSHSFQEAGEKFNISGENARKSVIKILKKLKIKVNRKIKR